MAMIPDADLIAQGYQKRDTYLTKRTANNEKTRLETLGYTAILDQTATGFWNVWAKKPTPVIPSNNISSISQ